MYFGRAIPTGSRPRQLRIDDHNTTLELKSSCTKFNQVFATFQKSRTVNEIDFHLGRLSWLAVRKALVKTSWTTYVMTFSCQGLYACISHSCVWARIGPTQATNKVTSYFTSHFSRLTNVQQGGVFIHTLTHVHQHMYNMHAYNDIKTKLHNTLTHNGEYTTTYFSPL